MGTNWVLAQGVGAKEGGAGQGVVRGVEGEEEGGVLFRGVMRGLDNGVEHQCLLERWHKIHDNIVGCSL